MNRYQKTQKCRLRALAILALSLLVLVLGPGRTEAQTTVYWVTSGTGTSGTWGPSSGTNWVTSSSGTGMKRTWNAIASGGKIATFSAGTNATGTYTVSVSGSVGNVEGINFQEGNVTLGGSGTLNLAGTPDINVDTTSATISAKLAGTPGFTKTGTGTLTLSGTNTYSGGTTLASGSLAIGNNNALGTGTLTVNGGTLLASGGARTVSNSVTVGGNFSIGGSNDLTLSGTINLGGGTRTVTIDNTGTTTFSGTVTEPWYSGLTKAGAGELVLSGNNDFSAPVSVSSGTLTLASNNALGETGTWGNTVSSGATLGLKGNITINEGGYNVSGAGAGGTGAIRNISGNNTLNGAVSIGGNTTFASDSGNLAVTGSMSIGSGRTLTIAGAGGTDLSGSISGSGSVTKTGTGTLTFSGSGSNSLSGSVNINSGTVALAKTGGANAIGGATVNVGDGVGAAGSAVLRLDASNQIANYADVVTVASDGTLALNNFTEGIDKLAGTGLVDLSTSGYLAVGVASGSSSFGGSIAGTGTFEKTGSGTLTLTGNIAFDGTLKLDGGTLSLSDISLSVGTLLVTGNTTIDFAGASSSLLLGNLSISSGVTLNILNWADAGDYFITQNWTGAVTNTGGLAPMNQVVFNGFGSAATQWKSYDKQITPVPEPSAYGAVLLGTLAGLAAWHSRRRKAAGTLQ